MTVAEFVKLMSPIFKDYAALRVGGRDEYSGMRPAVLTAKVTAADIAAVEARLEAVPDRAKAYRWILRGLSAAHALEKIRVDSIISRNAERSGRWTDEADAIGALKAIARGEIDERDVVPH